MINIYWKDCTVTYFEVTLIVENLLININHFPLDKNKKYAPFDLVVNYGTKFHQMVRH